MNIYIYWLGIVKISNFLNRIVGHKTTKENITQASLHAGVCTLRDNWSAKVSVPGGSGP